ncbi:hypothetical protein [Cellulomonas fimi]|uniref:Chromosome segregation protein SMC n=1 Tax=Cellulomonas fimi (strain ATCC 484 / DSM 20113 / JCM 1341 / CCUG 24087 / LMG 16345 / NBRC 15513 / NCIMB 8980 / NCTC 7547 / NRS-133) TaxID=590998 RepID=F4H684_CELFA|nr:hypothetical protein [Cellulomonas fimi]AEE44396.1 chromosome segregation protein SMC [Cellulomonas fimi ATCC 484]NNH08895.1 hypothetical protein [Cellulomonas fimi]VEH26277.1 Uncharacterised protein [Cellulomonas fimi]
MRDDDMTTDLARHRADEQRHAARPDDARPHLVDERDVRLALERLGLGERALTVHRATAFLTALGVTVTHGDGALARAAGTDADTGSGTGTGDRADDRGADRRSHTADDARDLWSEHGSADDGPGAGDVANLLEVRSHLRDRAPLPSAADLRARTRAAFGHRAVATA